MAQYPYGNPQYPPQYPPQYAPQQNQLYPQIPPQAFGVPGVAPAHPGFQYPSAPPQHPSAMSYPGMAPMPTVSPTPVYPNQQGSPIEWISCTVATAEMHANRAIVAGFEGHDGSPLWVIRAHHEGDLVPGKLAIKHKSAYIPWGGQEIRVHNIDVCVARPETIKWVQSQNGINPPNAIPGGFVANGEPLYIGRAREQGSLTPGKIHPSHKVMYMSFGGNEIPHQTYEVLCSV